MTYKISLQEVTDKIKHKKEDTEIKLQTLENELNDTSLNPYGITTIDFSERNEMLEDILKMEGVLMGLQLAMETYDEAFLEKDE